MIINKKILLYSLLAGLAFGASRSWPMEADQRNDTFPYNALPPELISRILTHAQQPFPIDLGSAAQDVGENVGTEEFTKPNEVDSPDGQYIAHGYDRGLVTIRPRRISENYDGEEDRGYEHYARSVRFSPNSQLIASGGLNGDVKIATINGNVIKEYQCQDNGNVLSICWSPNGKYIASGVVEKNNAVVVDIHEADGTLVKSYRAANHSYGPTLCFSPDTKYIASDGEGSYASREILIHQLNGNLCAKYKSKDTQNTIGMHFYPDGRHIFCPTSGKRISIIPMLLAQHQLTYPDVDQYLLLKRLKERLLPQQKQKDFLSNDLSFSKFVEQRKKFLAGENSLIIKEHDRDVLRRMPGLERLLCIEDNRDTKKAKEKLWQVRLRRLPETERSILDKDDTE